MAENNNNNISSSINNSQETASRFISKSYEGKGRDLVREFEDLNRLTLEREKVTLENIARQKKQLEQDLFHEKNTADLLIKKQAELAAKREELEKGKNNFSQEEMDRIANELYDLEQDTKALEAWHYKLHEQNTKLQNVIEDSSRELQESYGASFDAFEEINKIADQAKDEIEAINSAKQGVQLQINKTLSDIEDLYSDISNLDDEDLIREKREQIAQLKDELSELRETKDVLNDRRRAQQNILERHGLLSDQERGELRQQDQNETLRNLGSEAGSMLGTAIGGSLGGFLGGILGSAVLGGGEAARDTFTESAESGEIPDALEDIITELGGIDTLIGVVKNVASICESIRKQSSQYINDAANYLKSYYGTISANLQDSSYSYQAISEKADNYLTTSRWIKQTDYLSRIADLSNQGLLQDIETAAILDVIKNKTLTSFDTTNEGIRRLIRLGESDYIRQFGLEMQLKRVLNSVFNDSGYLQSMFDSVTSAIMDAATSYQGDVTAFNSTVQTWLGYMYSSGLSSNVITKIAEGINNLGSGNIQALASDESTQRLFLLAMDRAGLEYADILQQGLSLDDTNTLLSSIVQYLDEISNHTESNLVLRSSYANLFNLSVTDMKAINNLSSQISSISGYAVSSAGAAQNTVNAINNLVEANTTASEQFENLFSNLQYTFGESIAQNDALYSAYRISQETIKILQPFANLGGAIGKVAQAGQRVAGIAQYPILADGFIHLISDSAQSVFNNTIGGGLSTFLTSYMEGDTLNAQSAALATALSTTMSNNNTNSSYVNPVRTLIKGDNGLISQMKTYQADESWSNEEEGDDVKILKEMAKTLMKSDKGLAFAVSLEGMNQEVLRSFASIFADEDAMKSVFDGKNAAVSDKLFDYLSDSTSNNGTKA